MGLPPLGDLVKRFRKGGVRLLLGAAVILLSVLFLAYFIYKNRAALNAYPWQIHYGPLALTLILHLGAFLVAIAAWHSMIKRIAGASNLRLNAKIYCYGALAKRLPGVAWDIATRVVMYDGTGVSKTVVGVVSVLEIVLITLSGIVMYLVLAPLTAAQDLGKNFWLLLIALAIGITLTHPRVVAAAMRRLKRDAVPLSFGYRDTLRWVFAYAWTWILSGLMLYATICAIATLPSVQVLRVLSDWTFAGLITSLLTFLPSTLGIQEVSLTLLLSRYMPEHVAVVSAILMRVLTIAYSTLWTLGSTKLLGPERT